jgi:hypothetical protein
VGNVLDDGSIDDDLLD